MFKNKEPIFDPVTENRIQRGALRDYLWSVLAAISLSYFLIQAYVGYTC